MTSQTGQQIITIHILINNSRSEWNLTMKLGQLIQYHINIFLKKNHTQDVEEKLVPDPFIKIQNWAYLLIISLKYYKVCFHCISKFRSAKNTCFYFLWSFLTKRKIGLELVYLPNFLHDSWRKIFFMSYYFNWPNSIAWLPLLLDIMVSRCIAIIFCPVSDLLNFGINLSFLIKAFFYIIKNSRQIQVSHERK